MRPHRLPKVNRGSYVAYSAARPSTRLHSAAGARAAQKQLAHCRRASGPASRTELGSRHPRACRHCANRRRKLPRDQAGGGVGWGRAKGHSKGSQCGVQSAETSVKSSLGRPSELSPGHARSPCSASLSLRYGNTWFFITRSRSGSDDLTSMHRYLPPSGRFLPRVCESRNTHGSAVHGPTLCAHRMTSMR